MGSILLAARGSSECLNTGRSKVQELMRDGTLESVHNGACRRVTRAAVLQYVESLSDGVTAS